MSNRAITTLVLGAGASQPYGLLTGQQLNHRITSDLAKQPEAGKEDPLYVRLHKCGYDHKTIQTFTTRLENLEAESIDDFIEAHADLRDIACTAIAAVLAPREAPGSLRPSGNHWYRLLFNQLRTGGTYDSSWLRVLTFNYDRSLEQFLFKTLVDGMGWSEDKAAVQILNGRFLHLHGQLAHLPWSGHQDGYRDYHESCSDEDISYARRAFV